MSTGMRGVTSTARITAAEYFDGTGREGTDNTNDIADGGCGAPGGSRDEGTTGVACFGLRGVAFIGNANA